MVETRKLAAILAADVAGFSRLTGADEEGTMRRLRTLRADLIDPAIAANRGRVFKTTGDGLLIEFASVVDAARCALEVQRAMVRRNEDFIEEKQIRFRVGIHLGDVLVEEDGDLLGDGVNIAARLEGIAEPGGICLSEQAYWQVRDRLPEQFTDLGEKELKNIARPIRVYAIAPPGDAAPAQAGVHASDARTSTTVDPGFRRGGAKGEVIEKQAPPRLSMVVLPFANIGGDPEQEYFVDGVTESLTTDLSRISGSFVIARNTAFTYKGKPVDVKQIGRELNVRYVLEGSVQKGGQRLRVNVQLIEAESGAHLWAERFDKPVADLFDMQDEIVARLANQLGTELIAAEARRAEQSPHPDSMDLYFQGMTWVNKGVTLDYYTRARATFERAVALDPGNVDALVGIGRVNAQMVGGSLVDDRVAHLASAEAALAKALSLAPHHPWAHTWLGLAYIHTNRGRQAIAEAERALALDRNLAHARGGVLATANLSLGHAEESEGHIQEALRLSPRDSNVFIWAMLGGVAKLALGEDEAAVTWLRRSSEANRNFPLVQFLLAAALAHLGRSDEARAAVRGGLALDPGFTVGRERAILTKFGAHPVWRVQGERIIDGMRKAGVPEG